MGGEDKGLSVIGSRFAGEAHPQQALVTVLDSKDQVRRARAEVQKIGYSLELYGTPESGAKSVSPGSHHCLGNQLFLERLPSGFCLVENASACVK